MMAKVHEFEFGGIGITKRESSMAEPLPPQPSRLAWQLAFAHRVLREIADGVFRNRAAAARHYGITRARMTQLLDLVLLPPEVQEKILGPGVDDRGPATERAARRCFTRSPSLSSRTAP